MSFQLRVQDDFKCAKNVRMVGFATREAISTGANVKRVQEIHGFVHAEGQGNNPCSDHAVA